MIVDARAVYWMLCGAGATLLTSAWASKPVVPVFQNVKVETESAPASSLAGGERRNFVLARQPWAEPKSDPFSKSSFVDQNAASRVADEDQTAVSQQPVFPYVLVARMLADDKDVVFLSKNNQTVSVAAGETLEGIYHIERVGSDALEVIYLPERKKMRLSFDALARKVDAEAATLLQADAPILPISALPEGMIIESPASQNGNDMEGVNQMTNPVSTPEDVLKMMGATPVSEGNAVTMMSSPVPQGGLQALPGSSMSSN